MESLRETQKRKEHDIDKICSKHYEAFLDSMNEVLNIRTSIEGRLFEPLLLFISLITF